MLRKHKDVTEISKSRRYADDRPLLEKLFTEKVVRDKQNCNRKMGEAVEKHLYSQREIADQLGLQYAYVSRIINGRG